jgi:hydroxypyruvate isomerase
MQTNDIEHDEAKLSNETPGGSSLPLALPNQPTGWVAMAERMRAYDEDKIKDVKEDIDSLFIFVRLTYVLL